MESPFYPAVGGSSSRFAAVPAAIRSHAPATSAATSTSMLIVQPFPTRAAAPSTVEPEFMMLDQLVSDETREVADPFWDMRLDIGNMSYEELLALGESIGNVNTGLTDDKISKYVKDVVCCSSDDDDDDDGRCVFCLEGYKYKDLLGVLKCNHDFHADCIKKWLQQNNSCPVCKAAAA